MFDKIQSRKQFVRCVASVDAYVPNEVDERAFAPVHSNGTAIAHVTEERLW